MSSSCIKFADPMTSHSGQIRPFTPLSSRARSRQSHLVLAPPLEGLIAKDSVTITLMDPDALKRKIDLKGTSSQEVMNGRQCSHLDTDMATHCFHRQG